jgi:hypothetical protein
MTLASQQYEVPYCQQFGNEAQNLAYGLIVSYDTGNTAV